MSRIRIPVNLASQPFRHDRPVVLAAAAGAILLSATLVMLIVTVLRDREASRESREVLARLEAQSRQLDQQHAQIQTRLRQPASAAVINRSELLNFLLQRKGISWTRLYSDLEQVFPGNVRLVAVRPQVAGDNKVLLDMIVGSQSPEPVIELLQRLEQSPQFGATALVNSQPPSQNEPLYRYRVSVNYAQKL